MSNYRCPLCQALGDAPIPERADLHGIVGYWCDACDVRRNAIPDEEIAAVLLLIEAGTVTLTPREPWATVWAGDVTYDASNGWTVIVFNDCMEWDYIDAVVAPDGRRSELEWSEVLWRYRPAKDIEQRCYAVTP